MKLKIKDHIKCDKFKYIRSFSGSNKDLSFDYKEYYYNPDGSWNKRIIPRKDLEGVILDNETNANSIFEIVHIETTSQSRIHNDTVPSYNIYTVKKLDDPNYPTVQFADDRIDRRYFPIDLITKLTK